MFCPDRDSTYKPLLTPTSLAILNDINTLAVRIVKYLKVIAVSTKLMLLLSSSKNLTSTLYNISVRQAYIPRTHTQHGDQVNGYCSKSGIGAGLNHRELSQGG